MQFWGVTDLGCVRMQNEDALHVETLGKNAVLCAVCDGMGGAKSGDVASSLAMNVFVQEVKRSFKSRSNPAKVEQVLFDAVNLANFTVYEEAQKSEECAGMGTTLVAAIVYGKSAFLVNVGDSRAYAINKNGIGQLTVDHSLVQMMVQRGELSLERAKNYPGKNYITRAIGTEASVECDAFRHHFEKGEFLLLCSDGLTNVVSEQEILFEVLHGGTADTCCTRLVNIARRRGAPDNVSCTLVQI